MIRDNRGRVVGVGARAASSDGGAGRSRLGSQFRAGAAKAEVTPDLAKHGPVYLAGFGHNRVATGVHDRCGRAAWPSLDARKPLVMCAVDSIGLFLDDVEGARRLVPNFDLVVASPHDHEAPDTMGLWGPDRASPGSARRTTASWRSGWRKRHAPP